MKCHHAITARARLRSLRSRVDHRKACKSAIVSCNATAAAAASPIASRCALRWLRSFADLCRKIQREFRNFNEAALLKIQTEKAGQSEALKSAKNALASAEQELTYARTVAAHWAQMVKTTSAANTPTSRKLADVHEQAAATSQEQEECARKNLDDANQKLAVVTDSSLSFQSRVIDPIEASILKHENAMLRWCGLRAPPSPATSGTSILTRDNAAAHGIAVPPTKAETDRFHLVEWKKTKGAPNFGITFNTADNGDLRIQKIDYRSPAETKGCFFVGQIVRTINGASLTPKKAHSRISKAAVGTVLTFFVQQPASAPADSSLAGPDAGSSSSFAPNVTGNLAFVTPTRSAPVPSNDA